MSSEEQDPTPDQNPSSIYGVECPDHGKQGLTREEYERQMNKPNSLWTCPICKQVAWWDDARYEKGMGWT